LTVEFRPHEDHRIAVGDDVWVDLNPAEQNPSTTTADSQASGAAVSDLAPRVTGARSLGLEMVAVARNCGRGGMNFQVTHHLLTGVHIGTAKEMVHVRNSDIHASNGVIHVLDKVILP
jgi:hypothetical protein